MYLGISYMISVDELVLWMLLKVKVWTLAVVLLTW